MKSNAYTNWKAYFDLCEKDMLSNPMHYKYQKAYFRLGKKNYSKDVIYFPVEIRAGRISFGKAQFLITAHGVAKGILGEKWVERKTLIMQHDGMFEALEKATKELAQDTEAGDN